MVSLLNRIKGVEKLLPTTNLFKFDFILHQKRYNFTKHPNSNTNCVLLATFVDKFYQLVTIANDFFFIFKQFTERVDGKQ